MGLISKICGLFLIWMAFGFFSIAGYILVKAVQTALLDVENSFDVVDDWFDLVITMAGLGEDERDVSKEQSFLDWFHVCLLWPSYFVMARELFGSAYTQIKDEYDQGIRVRKEPS